MKRSTKNLNNLLFVEPYRYKCKSQFIKKNEIFLHWKSANATQETCQKGR